MSAGQDLIRFDASEDWQQIVNTTRNATMLRDIIVEPIGSFDLGVSIEAEYIAVLASSASSKPTWVFAGDITQVYDFAPGGSNPVTGKVRPQPFKLFINRMQVIPVGRLSIAPFRLQYTPPHWFQDCGIRVYKYTGTPVNFLEDKIFDIGQVLGLEPDTPEGYLALQFQSLRLLIDDRFQRLEERMNDCCGGSSEPPQTFGFSTDGGGNFEGTEPQDNLGFQYYNGFL